MRQKQLQPGQPPEKSFQLCPPSDLPSASMQQNPALWVLLLPWLLEQSRLTNSQSSPSKHEAPQTKFFFSFQNQMLRKLLLWAMRTMQLVTFPIWFWLQKVSTTDSILWPD